MHDDNRIAAAVVGFVLWVVYIVQTITLYESRQMRPRKWIVPWIVSDIIHHCAVMTLMFSTVLPIGDDIDYTEFSLPFLVYILAAVLTIHAVTKMPNDTFILLLLKMVLVLMAVYLYWTISDIGIVIWRDRLLRSAAVVLLIHSVFVTAFAMPYAFAHITQTPL